MRILVRPPVGATTSSAASWYRQNVSHDLRFLLSRHVIWQVVRATGPLRRLMVLRGA